MHIVLFVYLYKYTNISEIDPALNTDIDFIYSINEYKYTKISSAALERERGAVHVYLYVLVFIF